MTNQTKLNYVNVKLQFHDSGKYAGRPVVKLNLVGCNLQCKKLGSKENDPEPIYFQEWTRWNKVTTTNELPRMPFGCQSFYVWHDKFSQLWQSDSILRIGKLIHDELKEFQGYPKDLVLVIGGGEPLLQQNALNGLLDWAFAFFHGKGPAVVIETNGTIQIDDMDCAATMVSNRKRLFFSVHPKLKHVTGESPVCGELIRKLDHFEIPYELVFDMNETKAAWDELGRFLRVYDSVNFTRPKIYIRPVTDQVEQVEQLALLRGLSLNRRNSVLNR